MVAESRRCSDDYASCPTPVRPPCFSSEPRHVHPSYSCRPVRLNKTGWRRNRSRSGATRNQSFSRLFRFDPCFRHGLVLLRRPRTVALFEAGTAAGITGLPERGSEVIAAAVAATQVLTFDCGGQGQLPGPLAHGDRRPLSHGTGGSLFHRSFRLLGRVRDCTGELWGGGGLYGSFATHFLNLLRGRRLWRPCRGSTHIALCRPEGKRFPRPFLALH